MVKLISLEQEEEVVRLYRAQRHTIKQIMEMTGVRSEQTIYRILIARDIPKLKKRKPIRKVTIGIDLETDAIIRKVNPRNLSEFISEMIKKGYSNQ